MKRITIKEIARQAGVSIGTVDRVLHKRGEVSKKTTALVERIAQEGNYRANIIARGLRMKQENNIAILLPNDNEYWQTLNHGIAEEINEVAGIGMSVTSFVYDRHNPDSFKHQAEAMFAARPDGVVMAPILEAESRAICLKLDEANIPYSFVDSTLEAANPVNFIGQNSGRGGYLAAKLLTLGFPNGCPIYVILINDFDSLNKTIDERVIGLKRYIEEQQFDDCLVHEIGLNRNYEAVIAEARKLSKNGQPMHLFVPNSRANEVGEALSTVEGQFRIVGFDLVEKNRQALEQGQVDFIIDQNPARQGSEAIRSFYKLNVAREAVADVAIPLTIYTRENC
jgi:LacI family transcriptional regulator